MTTLAQSTGIENGSQRLEPAPLIAIASIILSMGLVAIGNGLMFAYVPIRLGAAGFDPAWAGLILTGLSAGGVVGCFLTGPLVRRVGHARAFMTYSALIILANAAGQRRHLSVLVDRLARPLRLRDLRPVHRRPELAERRSRQFDPRPCHGGFLHLLYRRPRPRFADDDLHRP